MGFGLTQNLSLIFCLQKLDFDRSQFFSVRAQSVPLLVYKIDFDRKRFLYHFFANMAEWNFQMPNIFLAVDKSQDIF